MKEQRFDTGGIHPEAQVCGMFYEFKSFGHHISLLDDP
jgi:hypothetical protein